MQHNPIIKLPHNYTERKPIPMDLVSRACQRYRETGRIIPQAQGEIYKNIAREIAKNNGSVIDVGCGIGVGSNYLSEGGARLVLGVDINEEAIKYAKQMFQKTTKKEHIRFKVADFTKRTELNQNFDYITSVECIEHIPSNQCHLLMMFMLQLTKKKTVSFLTSPNRNAPTIQKNTPRNPYHCFEANAKETHDFLRSFYKKITITCSSMKPQKLNTKESPLLYRLETPY